MCKMKKTLLIFILLISASALSAQEVSLSLKDCIDLSECNNPYIKNTYLDIQSAKFQKKEVMYGLMAGLCLKVLIKNWLKALSIIYVLLK